MIVKARGYLLACSPFSLPAAQAASYHSLERPGYCSFVRSLRRAFVLTR